MFLKRSGSSKSMPRFIYLSEKWSGRSNFPKVQKSDQKWVFMCMFLQVELQFPLKPYSSETMAHLKNDFEILMSKEFAGDADHSGVRISFKSIKETLLKPIFGDLEDNYHKELPWSCRLVV